MEQTQKLSPSEVFQKRLLRDITFKLLFAKCFSNDVHDDDAFFDMVLLDYSERQDKSLLLNEKDISSIIQKVSDITEHFIELDEIINKFMVGWKTERLSYVDLTILRMTIFDMKYTSDVPVSVAINEAVLLAKTFGNDKSKSFINGALSAINKYFDSGEIITDSIISSDDDKTVCIQDIIADPASEIVDCQPVEPIEQTEPIESINE